MNTIGEKKSDFFPVLFSLPKGIDDERTHVAFKRDPLFIKGTFFRMLHRSIQFN